jgi:hypothetical protein
MLPSLNISRKNTHNPKHSVKMFVAFIKNYVRVSALFFVFFSPFAFLSAQETHFNITSVDGHPLSGSLADTVFDGKLPRDVCHQSITEAEKQKDIPQDLLTAIALVEAGRWQGTEKNPLIWPWSLTVNGKGHFYETPELAINAAETFFAHGISNIDIGCMQINVRYHKNAFSDLAEMFDPIYNTAYAANFLVSLKKDLGTWSHAVEGYHSRKQEFGQPYGKKVMGQWAELRKKRRKDHQDVISLSNEQQRQKQILERAEKAQIRAEQQAKIEARRKELEGTDAGKWSRPSLYKQQQRDEITARARVLSPALKAPEPKEEKTPPQNSTPDLAENTIIYHSLKDNQNVNTSEQWLLQKLDEWEQNPPSQDSEFLP